MLVGLPPKPCRFALFLLAAKLLCALIMRSTLKDIY